MWEHKRESERREGDRVEEAALLHLKSCDTLRFKPKKVIQEGWKR